MLLGTRRYVNDIRKFSIQNHIQIKTHYLLHLESKIFYREYTFSIGFKPIKL